MLWLWCRLAAVALIGLLAWELPYMHGVWPKKQKKIEKKRKRKRERERERKKERKKEKKRKKKKKSDNFSQRRKLHAMLLKLINTMC